jgi:hypothetical protein
VHLQNLETLQTAKGNPESAALGGEVAKSYTESLAFLFHNWNQQYVLTPGITN